MNTLLPPQVQVLQFLTGRWVSQALGTVAQFGVADQLGAEPASAAELAQRCGLHEDTLHRVLRALASVGVFTQLEDGTFRHTALSETLRADHPTSVKAMALHFTHPVSVTAWNELPHSVRTGEPGFDKAFGENIWEFYGKNPEVSEVFNDAMTGLSEDTAAQVAAHLDFRPYKVLADIGGGHGALLRHVLGRHSHLRGILFDQADVTAGAAKRVPANVEIASGSFFETIPGGADLYCLKHILHDWNDEDCVRILQRIHSCSGPEAHVLIVESVLQPGNEPHFGKLLDLEMLVMTPGGRERSESDWRALLQRAGYKLRSITATDGPLSLLLAEKA